MTTLPLVTVSMVDTQLSRVDLPDPEAPMTLPLVTVSMVDTQLSRVDLPDPEAPMMPTNSPLSTAKDTSANARVTFLRLTYTFST